MPVKKLVEKITTKPEVKSYIIEVLEAFQNMNTNKLNTLLDEGLRYENLEKKEFIYQQKNIFSVFKNAGDTRLELSTNICTGCLCSEPVFVLTGNKSNKKYAIYMQFTKGEITDIFRCAEQSQGLGLMPF